APRAIGCIGILARNRFLYSVTNCFGPFLSLLNARFHTFLGFLCSCFYAFFNPLCPLLERSADRLPANRYRRENEYEAARQSQQHLLSQSCYGHRSTPCMSSLRNERARPTPPPGHSPSKYGFRRAMKHVSVTREVRSTP